MIIENIDFLELVVTVTPVLAFILGMVIYAIFIFKFYKFLAKRDIFNLNLKKYNNSKHPISKNFFKVSLFVIEYILFFPILVFFWFLILVILLSFLSKSQPLETILLISIAVVGAVRVTSYYSEDLSKDLAKMLPFALLGVFLVDLTFFSFGSAVDKVILIPHMFKTLMYYLVLIIIIEFVLRFLHFLIFPFKAPEKLEEK